jgi:hypothetical protein
VVPKTLLQNSELSTMEDIQVTNNQTFWKSSKKRCYYCNKKGHFKSECEKLKSNMKKDRQGRHHQNIAQVDTTTEVDPTMQDDIFAHLFQ